VIVLERIDEWALNRAVGHIEGTMLPGETGNIGIAGHRGEFFRCLRNISEGQIILFTTLQGTYQ
jgi:sortase A